MNEGKITKNQKAKLIEGENIVENNQKQEAVKNYDCQYSNIYSD